MTLFRNDVSQERMVRQLVDPIGDLAEEFATTVLNLYPDLPERNHQMLVEHIAESVRTMTQIYLTLARAQGVPGLGR